MSTSVGRFRAAWMLGALAPLLLVAYACGDETSSSLSNNTTGPGGTGGGSGGTGAAGGTGGTGGGTGGTGGTGGGTTTGADCTDASGTPGTVVFTPLFQGLTAPVMVTFAPGDSERIYIVEQTGQIRMSKNGADPTLFLDVSGQPGFTVGGERGLLGLAFHPNYTANGRFWVRYSALSPNRHVLHEFRRDPSNPDVADPAPVHAPTLEINKNNGLSNHNGGSIEFSPTDGMLYVTVGDGGDQGDPNFFAQTLTSYLGKILRIDVTPTDGSYTVPPGNIQSGHSEIFDWGLRNPYRMSFDLCTGDRYIGDVGQATYEEVDVAPPTQGPTNWGWNCFEGKSAYTGPPGGSENCPVGGEVLPVIDYNPGGGSSVIGGVVYRSAAIPWLKGWYFYGDYVHGFVRRFRYDAGDAVDDQLVDNLGGMGVTGFGNDNDGNVYVTHANGTVYKVESN